VGHPQKDAHRFERLGPESPPTLDGIGLAAAEAVVREKDVEVDQRPQPVVLSVLGAAQDPGAGVGDGRGQLGGGLGLVVLATGREECQNGEDECC
jgi:hypothetical protein